jgi:hypothetical protein
MLGVFLIALFILAAAAAAAAARRRQRRGAAGEVVRQPKDVERDVYEKLYGSRSSEGRISEAARDRPPARVIRRPLATRNRRRQFTQTR